MALPALNNKTAMGNLSLDDKSQILTSLVQSGKLQLVNYGAINFNQNITQATATKESSYNSFGEGIIRAINEIKGILYDLNNTMLRYVESNVTSQQISQNLLEAKARDIEVKGEDGNGFIGKDNLEKFYKVFVSMDDNIKKLVAGIDGGMFGGIGAGTGKGFLGGFLARMIPKLLKGFLFGAAGYGIYKAVDFFDDRKMNNSPWENIKKYAKDTFGFDFSEEGENQDQGDTATSTGVGSTQSVPTSNIGTSSPINPIGGGGSSTGISPQQTATPTSDVLNSPKTATPTKKIITNRGDIASDSDLIGIKFAQRKNNPDKNIVKGLAKTLQYIRKKLGGKPLFVNSGFRTFKHNKEVGGEKGSFHMKGWAADVSKQSIGSKKDQILFVKYAVEAGIGGIGFYDTFIHIDIRPRKNGRISRWNVNKFPKEALDIINNPGNYQIEESIATISETTNNHKEENENNDSGTSDQTTTETTPKNTSSAITPTKKSGENVQGEQGTTASPEYEDEQEEVGEKVLSESSTKVATLDLKEKSAVKESANASNEKKVFDFFVSKGFTKEQSAGITGSLKGESTNFDANQKQQGGGPGRGIAQWEGSRLKELKERKGNNWNTLKGQLEFIYEEITGATKDKSYKKVFNLIKSAKTAKEAAKIWTEKYEKPSKPKLQQRMVYAETIYKKYANNPTEIAKDDKKQPTTTTADNSTTNKNPKLDKKNEGQSTEPTSTDNTSTQPDQPEVVEEPKNVAETITDEFTKNIEEFKEKIASLKPGEIKSSIDESIFDYTKNLGETFGFDTSRLKKLPKQGGKLNTAKLSTEEKDTTAKLVPEVSESAGKRVEETSKAFFANKEEKAEKLQIAAQQPQQQQPIVNVSAGGGGGNNESSPVAGGISKMEVRDSVLHQTQYRKGSYAITV